MPRTLYLHCGPPKTGTSAIQAHFRDGTAHPDLLYPRTGQWGDGAHHHIPFALQGMAARGSVPVQPLPELQAALTREIAAAGAADVLISSEGFTPRETLPAFREAFAEALAGFDRVVTLVVLRHPLERAASSYNQNIKDSVIAETRLPDDYLARVGHGFALMPFVRRWRRAVPDAVFLNYHPARRLLHRFARALGRRYDGTPMRRNASFGGRAALALLLANRLAPSAAARDEFLAAMRRDPQMKLHQGSGFLFSRAAMQRYLAEGEADLQAVRDELGMDLTGLYPEPPPRFTLGEKQAAGLRARLRALNPDPAQRDDIDRILAAFTGPGGGRAPG